MKEFLFFILGLITGGFFMTIVMSFLQINRLKENDKTFEKLDTI